MISENVFRLDLEKIIVTDTRSHIIKLATHVKYNINRVIL